jgi:hypothetical protein
MGFGILKYLYSSLTATDLMCNSFKGLENIKRLVSDSFN